MCPTSKLLAIPVLLLSLSGCAERGPSLPEPYARMEVPRERLESREARQRGRELYLDNCVLCHGERADGRGARRASLDPKPRNYTNQAWRQSATPRSVYHAIAEGVQGTAMPAFDVLNEEQIWDITAYVLSVAEEGPYVEGVDAGAKGEETADRVDAGAAAPAESGN